MKLLWTEASGFQEQFQYLKSNRRVEDVPPVPAKEVPWELLHTPVSARSAHSSKDPQTAEFGGFHIPP